MVIKVETQIANPPVEKEQKISPVVLVVDSNQAMANLIAVNVKEVYPNATCTTLFGQSSETCLALLEEQVWDLVVFCYSSKTFPDTVLQQIKTVATQKGLPISRIFFTSRVLLSSEKPAKKLESEGFGFIAKREMGFADEFKKGIRALLDTEFANQTADGDKSYGKEIESNGQVIIFADTINTTNPAYQRLIGERAIKAGLNFVVCEDPANSLIPLMEQCQGQIGLVVLPGSNLDQVIQAVELIKNLGVPAVIFTAYSFAVDQQLAGDIKIIEQGGDCLATFSSKFRELAQTPRTDQAS